MRQIVIHAPDPDLLATGLSGITPGVIEEILNQATRWDMHPQLMVDAQFASFYRELDPQLIVGDSGRRRSFRSWIPPWRAGRRGTQPHVLWHVPWTAARWLPPSDSTPLLVSLPSQPPSPLPFAGPPAAPAHCDTSRLLDRASLFTVPEQFSSGSVPTWHVGFERLGRPLLAMPKQDARHPKDVAQQFLWLYQQIVEARIPYELVDTPPRTPPSATTHRAQVPTIGLVICTFNRPELLRATLASLETTTLPTNTVVALVDDGSTDLETRQLIHAFALDTCPVHKIYRVAHDGFGVHDSLRIGWDYLHERYGLSYFVNLDSDTVLRREWLVKSLELFQRERARRGPLLVTGFHTTRHPIVEVAADHYRKASCGGVHMLFDGTLYEEVIRPSLRQDADPDHGWDWQVVDAMRSRGYPCLCTRPSVLQHIGMYGQYSRGRHWLSGKRRWDSADDFVPDDSALAGLNAYHTTTRPEAA
jgi:hypothetical protein